MKKLFAVLCTVMFVFCIAGSADATRFGFGGWHGPNFSPPSGNGPRSLPDLSKLLGMIGPLNLNGSCGPNFDFPRPRCGPSINFDGHCGIMLCQPPVRCNKPVPEPATMLLLGGGLAGLGLYRKKFKKK